ncbi:XF1762 family protein [Amycolatopsis roodepoortensis]|uniref:XF1762 family protein n=1 Tax=Amycolatopsis roodepoortensis TaxID=700274 RepID=UPI003531201D
MTRTRTTGTRNANSKPCGVSWRVARPLGFLRLITYTQDGESGASLRAAGFRPVAGGLVHSVPTTRVPWCRRGRRTRWEIRAERWFTRSGRSPARLRFALCASCFSWRSTDAAAPDQLIRCHEPARLRAPEPSGDAAVAGRSVLSASDGRVLVDVCDRVGVGAAVVLAEI